MLLIKLDCELFRFSPFLLKVAEFDKLQNNQKVWLSYSLFGEWLWLRP